VTALGGSDKYFVCAVCFHLFEKGWSDEEALTEAAIEFPHLPIEDSSLVCDECYKQIMPEARVGNG
jgi:hypothetical protein